MLTRKEIIVKNIGNEAIALALGYKLISCNNGKAWSSPYPLAVDDVLKIHGLLQTNQYSYMKFSDSFDSFIPVVRKISLQCGFNSNFITYHNIHILDLEVMWNAVANFAIAINK